MGSIDPTEDSVSTDFSAHMDSGSGSVTATYNDISGSADVEVFSESPPPPPPPPPSPSITGLDPSDKLALAYDLTVYYHMPGSATYDSAELHVYNKEDTLVYCDEIEFSSGGHTTVWPQARWNQPPNSGAYANPRNGKYKVKIVATSGGEECESNEKKIDTTFIIEADIADELPGGADATAVPAGLADLGDAIIIWVENDVSGYGFGGVSIEITGQTQTEKHIKAHNSVLDRLDNGEWTIQLWDVRDEIGNFYDLGPYAETYEWTISIY